jgi:hypothetical protein
VHQETGGETRAHGGAGARTGNASNNLRARSAARARGTEGERSGGCRARDGGGLTEINDPGFGSVLLLAVVAVRAEAQVGSAGGRSVVGCCGKGRVESTHSPVSFSDLHYSRCLVS